VTATPTCKSARSTTSAHSAAATVTRTLSTVRSRLSRWNSGAACSVAKLAAASRMAVSGSSVWEWRSNAALGRRSTRTARPTKRTVSARATDTPLGSACRLILNAWCHSQVEASSVGSSGSAAQVEALVGSGAAVCTMKYSWPWSSNIPCSIHADVCLYHTWK